VSSKNVFLHSSIFSLLSKRTVSVSGYHGEHPDSWFPFPMPGAGTGVRPYREQVKISTMNGIHWLHVQPKRGIVYEGDLNAVSVSVSVENEDLPPGIYEGTLVFIPGHSKENSRPISVCFNILGLTNPASCPP